MENNKIRVAITHGDTNGVGYELIFKTFSETEMLDLCTPIVYGSPKTAAYHRKALSLPGIFTIINDAQEAVHDKLNMLTTFDEEVKVEFGEPTKESGNAAIQAINAAMRDYKEGFFDVLVTAPISISDTVQFSGHTQYIKDFLKEEADPLTIYVNEKLKVAVLSDTAPIKDALGCITIENIKQKAKDFFLSLKRDFRIANPRIAVLSLNPQLGENEFSGHEEKDIIIPAINELSENEVNIFGPFAADNFFGSGDYNAFDGILAMYHDQGTAPFMAMSNVGVKVLSGLSLVVTSSLNTPEFEKAGKNLMDATSFRHAIFQGIDIWRNRISYDEPFKNPLRKLYHEKRDESEKVRFSIPKKREHTNKEKKTEE